MSWLFVFGLGSVLFGFPSVKVIPITLSFSFFTAAGFLINQYFDYGNDVLNPAKKDLPIASGALSKGLAKIIIVFLLMIGFLIVLMVENSLIFLFLLYFVLGIMYSVPPFSLKKRPLIDLLVVGVVSGVLPFLIGLQVSNWLRWDFSSIWMRIGYEDAFLSALPLFFFQVSGHIFQAIGDYNSDARSKINTFVVKYGKEKSAKFALNLFSLSTIMPILYGGLSITKQFQTAYTTLFLLSLPFMVYVLNIFRKPNTQNIRQISRFINKFSPFLLPSLFVCIVILRASLH